MQLKIRLEGEGGREREFKSLAYVVHDFMWENSDLCCLLQGMLLYFILYRGKNKDNKEKCILI